MELTHGNLFSGSGTWELAAKLFGIRTLWEAEIEPFPVALEAVRFPEAKQLGDVSKIHGWDIEPVDIMTNSSPCQDLSVAGGRSGLAGERSGLFADAVRIAKEMRDAQRRMGAVKLRPRFWCWENVPGAFSSNQGEDFRSVLEQTAKIADETVSIPRPPKGKWEHAGVVDGDGWQIAWRTMDAQFYGVPQRRRRVFLVADFGGGGGAAEILFERESVPWHFAEVAKTWQDTSRSLGERIASAREYLEGRRSETTGGLDPNVKAPLFTSTLTRKTPDTQRSTESPTLSARNTEQGGATHLSSSISYGLDRASFNQGKNAKFGFSVTKEVEPTITAKGAGGGIPVYSSNHGDGYHTIMTKNMAASLMASDYKDPPIVYKEENG